jgi:hypothetical protein
VADPNKSNPPPHDPEPPEGEAGTAGPLDELPFGGPLEELDFAEPTELSFLGEPSAEGAVPPEAEMGGEPAAGEPAAEALPAEGAETMDFGAAFAAPGTEETAAETELAGEGLPDLGEPAAEAPVAEGEEAEEEVPAKRPAWLAYVDWAGLVLLAVVIWLVVRVVVADVFVLWTTAYLILLVLIPFSLWKSRHRWTTPQITAAYTVFLAISVAALLTAVYWLGLELFLYEWDVKAKTRPVVGAAQYPGATSLISDPLAKSSWQQQERAA